FDGTDVLLGTRTVTNLAPGGSSAATTVLTIPVGTPPGTYRVLVRADDNGTGTGAVGETDEGNNQRATGPITIALPDLRVTAVTEPATALSGAVVTVSHTVQNAAVAPGGGAPASTSKLYLSTDQTVGGAVGAFPPVAIPIVALGAGQSVSVAKPVSIPVLPVGVYYFVVRADDSDAIAESNEGNNVKATATPLLVWPDLIVTAVSGPAKAAVGQVVSVSATVQNVGTLLSAGQSSTLAFYLSQDGLVAGATRLAA